MFEATAKYAKLRMKEWKGQSIAVTDWVQHRLSDFLFAPAHWRQPAVRKWYLAGRIQDVMRPSEYERQPRSCRKAVAFTKNHGSRD
ncbi:hypothetical protein MRX96_035175 [Rhipicephalus microplus]